MTRAKRRRADCRDTKDANLRRRCAAIGEVKLNWRTGEVLSEGRRCRSFSFSKRRAAGHTEAHTHTESKRKGLTLIVYKDSGCYHQWAEWPSAGRTQTMALHETRELSACNTHSRKALAYSPAGSVIICAKTNIHTVCDAVLSRITGKHPRS